MWHFALDCGILQCGMQRRRSEQVGKPGLYCLLTNQYWWSFTHGPVEWQGERIIGSPNVVQAWKLPGDLYDLVDGTYMKVSQVTKGQTTFHAAAYKEILHTSWGGWSPHAFTFRVGAWQFKRGLFAEKHGSCNTWFDG